MQEQADASGGSCCVCDDDVVSALLQRPLVRGRVDPKALFLGPKAENADLVEGLLLKVYRGLCLLAAQLPPGGSGGDPAGGPAEP